MSDDYRTGIPHTFYSAAVERAEKKGSDWREFAACRGKGPDIFFLTPGESTAPAKALCRECPVASPCRAYALAIPGLQGLWAGTSEQERERIRRRRKRGAA